MKGGKALTKAWLCGNKRGLEGIGQAVEVKRTLGVVCSASYEEGTGCASKKNFFYQMPKKRGRPSIKG